MASICAISQNMISKLSSLPWIRYKTFSGPRALWKYVVSFPRKEVQLNVKSFLALLEFLMASLSNAVHNEDLLKF